ncbi:hypothetical protein BYT27DRAFT_7257105 [Phlegmacium glaucopus]|nr:hypothetical protein BYT27DRAFT_7257105 [Phlegmacium glaucopus]
MLSKAQEQALVNICNLFIDSGEEVGLLNLLDLVNSTINDHKSQEWKAWTKHMDELNECWRHIQKEGEDIPWPKPPTTQLEVNMAHGQENPVPVPSGDLAGSCVKVKTSPQIWEYIEVSNLKNEIEKIVSKCKLAEQGDTGVGPAQQETSISSTRKAAVAGPGKPHDALVDDLIVEVEEPHWKRGGEMRTVVYCVGCQKKSVGQSPNRIKQHGKDCSDLATKFPELYAEIVKDLAQ